MQTDARFGSAVSLRAYLFGAMIVLAIAAFAVTLAAVYGEAMDFRKATVTMKATVAFKTTIQLRGTTGRERGIYNSLLLDNGADIKTGRSDRDATDREFATAIQAVSAVGTPEALGLVAELQKVRVAFAALRSDVDATLDGTAPAARRVAPAPYTVASNKILGVLDEVADSLQILADNDASPTARNLIEIGRLSNGLLRDAGARAGFMERAVSTGTAIDPKTAASMGAMAGRIDQSWARIQGLSLAFTPTASPLAAAIQKVQSLYFGDIVDIYQTLADRSARGAPYGITGPELFGRTATTMRVIPDIQEAALENAIAMATASRDARLRRLWAAVALLMLVGGIAGLSILFVRGKVILPMSALTATVLRLADDERDILVPELSRRDEMGQLAHAIDTLRLNAIRASDLELERREMEARIHALTQQEATTAHEAMEIGHMAKFEYDVDLDRIEMKNGPPTLFRAGQWKPSEQERSLAGFIGRFVQEEDREKLRADLARCIAWNDPSLAIEEEIRLVNDEGMVRWMVMRVRYMVPAEDYGPRILGIFADIDDRKRAEREISLFKEVAEQCDQGIGFRLSGHNSQFQQYMNPAERDMLGIKLGADIKDFRFRQFYVEADQVRLEHEIRPLVEEHGHWTGELRMRSFDGQKIIPVILNLFAIRDQGGRQIGLAHILTDLTRQKEAEARLRLLGNVFEQSASAVTVADMTYRLVAVNPAFTRLTGYSLEEVVGKRGADLVRAKSEIPLTDRPDVVEKLNQDGYWEGESRGRRKDGSEFPRAVCLSAVRDEKGIVTHRVVTFTDITERQEAEAQLRLLGSVFEQSGEAIVVADASGRLISVNPAFTKLTGYEPDEVIGKLPTYTAGGEPLLDQAEVIERLRTDGHWQGENRVRRKDGSEFTRWISLSEVRDENGRPSHYVSAFTDITERKLAEEKLAVAREEALAATQAKSDFLANMSHEIRTPMNAVLGLTHLALKNRLDDKQRDYLGKIQSSATALLGVINDILDFSKIEAGRIDLENVPFSLNSVIENVTNVSALRAEEKGLALMVSVEPAVPLELVGDPLRLGQVMLNLVSNAVKFTEHGEVTIKIGIAGYREGGVDLAISIRDTGIGMNEAQLSRLFKSFTQADSSMTRRYGGTGLGLAISKRLIEMMGGNIFVESRPSAGSIFSFTARMGTTRLGLRVEGPAHSFAAQSRLAKLKVLVVDDEPGSRGVMTDILAGWSIPCETASSGMEAIGMAKGAVEAGAPFDLILMDWKMPEMDGIETTRALRSDSALPDAPVIFMVTAFAREEVMMRAESVRIDAFLVKPVEPSLLLDAIVSIFGGKTEPAATRAPEAPSASTQSLAGIRLLVAEDNEINQLIAVEILEHMGVDVAVAGNGRIAVERILANPWRFDAVLMDIQMPEMDGLEATRQIREIFDADRLPIIAMTAHAMEQERQRCLEAGMNDHVAKPIDPAVLAATLGRWVKPRPDRAARPSDAPRPAEPPEAEEDDLLRKLPSFDLDAALDRLQGNRPFLRKLILDFHDRFAESDRKLRDFVSEGTFREAELLAHSLAGVGGQLGAMTIFHRSRALERALHDRDQADYPHLLDALGTELAAVLAQARSLRPPEPAPTAPQTAAAAVEVPRTPIDGEALAASVSGLRALLGQNSFQARQRFVEFSAEWRGSEVEPHLGPLSDQIGRLDFRAAERTLDAMMDGFAPAGSAT